MSNVEASLSGYLQWLAVEKGRSRATIEAYGRDVRRLLGWMAEQHLALNDLADADLERYANELRDERLAESTIARHVASIRGWLRFLTAEHYLVADPSERLHASSRRRSLPKALAEEEVARLIDAVVTATAVDRRDRALLELLYGTGARISEVVSLNLEDLDFDEELIRVTGKGSKQRLVPMGRALHTSLIDYLGSSGRQALLGPRRTSRVFVNVRGGPISRQGIDFVLQGRALAAGVERSRVSAHVFRHSCATHMLAHGADIRVVQELLGHASIATTQIYTGVAVSSLQREYANAHPRAHD